LFYIQKGCDILKKFINMSLVFFFVIILFGCNQDNSKIVYYHLTLSGENNYLAVPLESKYPAGEVVEIVTQVIMDADIVIYLNDELVEKTYHGTPNWKYQFIMPAKDSTLEFTTDGGLYKETIFSNVEMLDPMDTSEYFERDFDSVDFVETYDLSQISSMIGDHQSQNFAYGSIITANLPTSVSTERRFVINEIVNDDITQKEYYQSKTEENGILQISIYQYVELTNGVGIIMNQTNDEFTKSSISMENEYTFYVDLSPARLEMLYNDTANVTYQVSSIDDLTFLKIAGTISHYPNRLEFYEVECEMIYVIIDNQIIAWYYTETSTSPLVSGIWQITQYCVPFDTDEK